MVNQSVGLVGFQRGGNGQMSLSISVQDVDQLLLLNGTYKKRSLLMEEKWKHRLLKITSFRLTLEICIISSDGERRLKNVTHHLTK